MEEQTPLYTHDCDQCKYLGRSTYVGLGDETREADVYYCVGTENHAGKEESIVVRWRNQHEFHSHWPYFIFYLKRCEEGDESKSVRQMVVPYLFGLERARKRGLVQTGVL